VTAPVSGGPRRSGSQVEVQVGGRTLRLSNLEKVLWPEVGFTKGGLIDYYARIAPAMLPHLTGRPLTLRRWPNGVDGSSFFEKNCPSHRPDWVKTVEMGDVSYCEVDEPAALVWLANLASIELHPTLARAPRLDRPTAMVFDLDPGAPADVTTCARVAVLLRQRLAGMELKAWVKTSGSKGLQLYVPLNSETSYEHTKPFSHTLAEQLEREHRDLVVSTQERNRRRGKVLIDWSQNTASKTTVAVYSVRAVATPSVSVPLTWDEVEALASGGDPGRVRFTPAGALARVAEVGDLMAPVLEVRQQLPAGDLL